MITLAAGALIGVAAVGTAAAASSTSAVKVATHHYALAASAFAPDSLSDTAQDYANEWDPTSLSNPDSYRCFNAGLSLPFNATLKSITIYYTEGNVPMAYQVNRQNLTSHTGHPMISGTAPNIIGKPVYNSITRAVPKSYANVDMGRYAYSAGVCPHADTAFAGLIVTYTVPAS